MKDWGKLLATAVIGKRPVIKKTLDSFGRNTLVHFTDDSSQELSAFLLRRSDEIFLKNFRPLEIMSPRLRFGFPSSEEKLQTKRGLVRTMN